MGTSLMYQNYLLGKQKTQKARQKLKNFYNSFMFDDVTVLIRDNYVINTSVIKVKKIETQTKYLLTYLF